jgi:hypothetical protein
VWCVTKPCSSDKRHRCALLIGVTTIDTIEREIPRSPPLRSPHRTRAQVPSLGKLEGLLDLELHRIRLLDGGDDHHGDGIVETVLGDELRLGGDHHPGHDHVDVSPGPPASSSLRMFVFLAPRLTLAV